MLKNTQCFLEFLSKQKGELCEIKNTHYFHGNLENLENPFGEVNKNFLNYFNMNFH